MRTSTVEVCGYHCRGELVPAHVCAVASSKESAPVKTHHADHAGHAGHRPAAGKSMAHDKAEMMHEMGHAPGRSMQDMARDMRNRFLVALLFAIPVFLRSR